MIRPALALVTLMRGQKRILPFLLAALSITTLEAQGEEDATRYVEFAFDFHAQCVSRNGKMQQLVNAHPDRAIKVYLYRYFGGKRQPGRTAHTLKAGAGPEDLGCTLIDGQEQSWEIVKAKFEEE